MSWKSALGGVLGGVLGTAASFIPGVGAVINPATGFMIGSGIGAGAGGVAEGADAEEAQRKRDEAALSEAAKRLGFQGMERAPMPVAAAQPVAVAAAPLAAPQAVEDAAMRRLRERFQPRMGA